MISLQVLDQRYIKFKPLYDIHKEVYTDLNLNVLTAPLFISIENPRTTMQAAFSLHYRIFMALRASRHEDVR